MRTVVFFLVLGILSGCISPVNLDPSTPDRLIAVDGFISDQEGPYEIIIHEISRFAGTLQGGTEQFVTNAEVYITDQDGIRTDLTTAQLSRLEADCLSPPRIVNDVPSRGYFTPNGFRGEVGNTYTLHINTTDRSYVSTPQTIVAGPEIDSVGYLYRRLPSTDPVVFGSGVDVFVSWTDPVEARNFYSWRLNGIYRVDTPPVSGRCCPYFPDGNGMICWINEENVEGNRLAFSDDLINGNEVTERVGFIEDNGLRFNNPVTPADRQYYVSIQQLSISGEAFAFYKLLESQLAISGSIFDPPPAALIGNMRNIDNPDENVIGFFGAFSIREKGTFINRNDLDFVQRYTDPCGDCRKMRWARLETPQVFNE